jgi:hypothetical protein
MTTKKTVKRLERPPVETKRGDACWKCGAPMPIRFVAYDYTIDCSCGARVLFSQSRGGKCL